MARNVYTWRHQRPSLSPKSNLLALTQLLDDAVSGLDLQRERLFELLKQALRLNRIVPVARELSHKRKLPLDSLLTSATCLFASSRCWRAISRSTAEFVALFVAAN